MIPRCRLPRVVLCLQMLGKPGFAAPSIRPRAGLRCVFERDPSGVRFFPTALVCNRTRRESIELTF